MISNRNLPAWGYKLWKVWVPDSEPAQIPIQIVGGYIQNLSYWSLTIRMAAREWSTLNTCGSPSWSSPRLISVNKLSFPFVVLLNRITALPPRSPNECNDETNIQRRVFPICLITCGTVGREARWLLLFSHFLRSFLLIIYHPYPQPLWGDPLSCPCPSYLSCRSSESRVPGRRSRGKPERCWAVQVWFRGHQPRAQRAKVFNKHWKFCVNCASKPEQWWPSWDWRRWRRPSLVQVSLHTHLTVETLFKVELGAKCFKNLSLSAGRGTRRLQIWPPNS